MHLDHITVRTRDLAGTRAFFLKVFDDLQERARPKAIHRIPGHWLFAGDRPIVHLIGSHGSGLDGAAEAFDHVGIYLENYVAFRTKLERLGIPYSKMDLPELEERRLFFSHTIRPAHRGGLQGTQARHTGAIPMNNDLFDPLTLGPNSLRSRIAMAPMTRSRSTQPGNVPNAMMAEYYAQRASAGLIITEATQISQQGQGYSFTPGIHSAGQVRGWKTVTDAVHAAGGRIFNQLWHVGRMSHSMFHEDGLPVAPSAIAPDATVWVVDPDTGQGGMVECPTPRALEISEIADVIADYALAARNAKAAGFDGVEVHAANGYLIDAFLRASSNRRTDQYGGRTENRIRFAVEAVAAVAAEIGADRVGIRISPFITQRGMDDPDAPETILAMARELDRLGIAYIHIAEADWDDAPETPHSFREALRAAFSGAVIVAGGYDRAKAEAILADGLADVVAFGRPFIANPDLPRRLVKNLPLAEFDGGTLFGGGTGGYTTYPHYEAAA